MSSMLRRFGRSTNTPAFFGGVVLAEVELVSRDQHVELSEWVGPEVTEEAKFRKVNLLRERQGMRTGS